MTVALILMTCDFLNGVSAVGVCGGCALDPCLRGKQRRQARYQDAETDAPYIDIDPIHVTQSRRANSLDSLEFVSLCV